MTIYTWVLVLFVQFSTPEGEITKYEQYHVGKVENCGVAAEVVEREMKKFPEVTIKEMKCKRITVTQT